VSVFEFISAVFLSLIGCLLLSCVCGIGLGVVIKKLNPIDEGPILTDEQAECEYRTDIDLITGNEKKEEK
jgi:hypothetical protein